VTSKSQTYLLILAVRLTVIISTSSNPSTKEEIPYLLDIQNDILKSLNTRVVGAIDFMVTGF